MHSIIGNRCDVRHSLLCVMRSYYPVTCKACGLLIRVAEKVLPPLYCSRGAQVEIPTNVQLVTPKEFVRGVQAGTINTQHGHWHKLHCFPFSDDWGCQSRCQWWKNWQETIPNIGCDCRKHWKAFVEQNPPSFASREAFFAWTVYAHNQVNKRLGKPELSIEAAMEAHGIHPEQLDAH